MAKSTLLGSIELTKLNKVFIKNFKNKEGQLTPCLCIPMEENQIYEFPVKDKDGNLVPDQNSNRFGFEFRASVNDEKDQYGRNGLISKKLTKEEYKANKDNEEFLKYSQPILGNFIKLDPINPDGPSNVVPPVVDSESDNIPF